MSRIILAYFKRKKKTPQYVLVNFFFFYVSSQGLFTSVRWSWWRPPPRWSCAAQSRCRWSCRCRRSHCRWSRPCQQCGAQSYCGTPPRRSDLREEEEEKINSVSTCKVTAIRSVKSSESPAARDHLAGRAHPTGRSTPLWTGWLRSDCRLHQSHTGWWCCAAPGCARLSGGPRGCETLYSGRCRWPCHPEGNTKYNLKSHYSLLFYWLYKAKGKVLIV